MKVVTRNVSVLVFFALVLFMTGCGSQSSTTGGGTSAKKICFSYQSLDTPFWVGSYGAITKGLKADGYQIIERDGHKDANVQLQQIKDCISQRVAGIFMIEQDGDSAVTMIGLANKANIPIVVFNRPPATGNTNPGIVVVADNEVIAEASVNYLTQQAMKLGHKVHPLIMVGDLGDPNAIERKKGFDTVIGQHPDLFFPPVYVDTHWDAATGLAHLQDAMQAHPDVDFIFTSSDFLYPQIKSVLSSLGRWKPVGDPKHIILGGLDGDPGACALMKSNYVDSTGVQDVFYEARVSIDALKKAIDAHNGQPNQLLVDKGFAMTQANIQTREKDMWGCTLPPNV